MHIPALTKTTCNEQQNTTSHGQSLAITEQHDEIQDHERTQRPADRPTDRRPHHPALPEQHLQLLQRPGGQGALCRSGPGFIYSRFGNPTTAELEQKLAALEGADEALVVASGMAAVSAIMYALADSGDEMAYIGPLYGGTDAFLKQTFSRAGIKVTAYESDRDLLANIRPATKVVLFETLTNPTLKVVDPRLVVEAARKVGAITVCDNTFLTPTCCARWSSGSM